MVPGYADGQELGRGPAGRTVLARHTATGAAAVIRYLAIDETLRSRYRELARRLVGLRSPHVAELYEHVETDDGVAVVREYVNGASLSVLAAAGAMKPEHALTVLKGRAARARRRPRRGRRARRVHANERGARRHRPGHGHRLRAGGDRDRCAGPGRGDRPVRRRGDVPREPRRGPGRSPAPPPAGAGRPGDRGRGGRPGHRHAHRARGGGPQGVRRGLEAQGREKLGGLAGDTRAGLRRGRPDR